MENSIDLKDIYEDLKQNLSSHLSISLRKHILTDTEYVRITKNSFVGLKIYYDDDNSLVTGTFIPGILSRAFFGGFISWIFLSGSQKEFQQTIVNYLCDKYFSEK
jgi:hypothetical protein